MSGWRAIIVPTTEARDCRRVRLLAPDGERHGYDLLPNTCPQRIEEHVAAGEVDEAKALAAGWLAALGLRHGVRGLELPA